MKRETGSTKRLAIGWTALMLVVVAVGYSWSSQPTAAQDDDSDLQTRVASLETRVAVLETQVVASTPEVEGTATQRPRRTPEPTAATDEAAEATGEEPQFVGGNAASLLPPGEDGALAAVAIGPYDGNILPVVVRNNTDEPVADVTATGVARASDGSLLASGGSQGFRPYLVAPGQVTIGYLYFDGASLPSDVTFELEIDASDPEDDTFIGVLDLEVIEASVIDDRIVGEMRNPHDEQVSGPISLVAVCFDDEGTLLSLHLDFADKEEVDPGDDVPFQVSLFGAGACEQFLVAGQGFSF